jgi:hypothetical protein
MCISRQHGHRLLPGRFPNNRILELELEIRSEDYIDNASKSRPTVRTGSADSPSRPKSSYIC